MSPSTVTVPGKRPCTLSNRSRCALVSTGTEVVDADDLDILAAELGKIKVSAERDPSKLPWKELGVDIAMECTGIFTAKDKASAHLTAGAKRVLVSAPADNADATIVYGVNHDTLTRDHWSSPTAPAPPTASRRWPRC